MRTYICAAIVASVGLVPFDAASAREMPSKEKFEARIDAIKARYQPEFDALRQRADEATRDTPSKEESMTGVSLGKMHRVDWYVKVPEITVREQTWYVKVPEFRMDTQRIVWHMPEPCMKYEEFPWGGGMHVPEICMREKDWRLDLPTTTMHEQKWILWVPEVTMREQHWILDVPEIKFESSKKRIDQAWDRAEAVGRDGQALSDSMQREIKAEARAFLTEWRNAVAEQFDGPAGMLRAAVAASPDQAKAFLNEKLADIEKARSEALKLIDDQLAAVS